MAPAGTRLSLRLKRIILRIPVLGALVQRAYHALLARRYEPIPPPDLDLLRALGYEFETNSMPERVETPAAAPPSWPAEDLYFVTVCSVNHAPFARTLCESIARHHGPAPIVVVVVDARRRDEVAIGRAIVLTGRDVFGPDLDYTALKLSATELCCAAKAYVLDYLLGRAPARRFVYLDSDIYVFARLDAMIARLDEADFVVTPHTIQPLPAPERFWEKPSLGDLAGAGVFNAGMIAMRRSAAAGEFLQTWKRLVAGPGAFVSGLGAQAEQNSFNWISCFVESYAVLRDTAYNVAYWNLHDRSLRCVGDGRWTVDGRPLVTFHFSGFSPASYVLSKYDNRYSLHLVPALARLRDFYASRLEANDHGELDSAYGFESFPSGIRIDGLMREIYRTHEEFLRTELSPWTPAGEASYARALLAPIPYTRSLAPILMQHIFDRRADLRFFGDVTMDPTTLVGWMLEYGVGEQGYEDLFDRHRPVVPTIGGALLMTRLRARWPRLFERLPRAMYGNRREFLARLDDVAPEDARLIRHGGGEQFLVTRIGSVKTFVRQRPDLLDEFPDLLFDDAPRFVRWLHDKRLKEHFLPVEAIDTFAQRANGRSLARLFSYLSRNWNMMEAWPLGLVGEGSADLARAMLDVLRHPVEYDIDDIEMFRWIVEVKPWAGLPLTLELPIHATRHPSSRSRAGQAEILAPVLGRDRDRRFAMALDRYRAKYPPVADHAPPSRLTAKDVSVLATVRLMQPQTRRPLAKRPAPGANVFGYHRSDTGLGQMTRGLVRALRVAGCETSPAVLGNMRMDDDLGPDDFIRTYDVAQGTNIFVSYPHLHNVLLRTIPDEVTKGHRNIAYLAWEQRDGTHYWKDVYGEYDQIWALSDFTAQALSEVLERSVHSVPCVVDVDAFPPASSKSLHGLRSDAFTFLLIFDANSSTERKNPEAVVHAFRKAFRADDPVRLVIKPFSGGRMGNRVRLQRFMAAVRGDRMIEVRMEDLTRHDSYGLISACDCFVSLHRAEGFGYACAEAMAYGKPVIATGYSGNMQFMSETNSYPVRYEEIEASVQEGPFYRGSLWAEPDIDHAAELMRYVYEERAEAAARGALGRATIERDLSPTAIAARVTALLDPDAAALEAEVVARVRFSPEGGRDGLMPATR